MSISYFKELTRIGVAFESIKSLELELQEIFGDVINKANNGAFKPIEKGDGKSWLKMFSFSDRENTKIDYNNDYLVITTQNLEIGTNFFAKTKDGKTIEISRCKYTFDLDFCGPYGFDSFFLLRNNFKKITSGFENLSSDNEADKSYFDLSKSDVNPSYQKSDISKYVNVAWSGIIFTCFIIANTIQTIKDIQFFIQYDR